MVRTKGGSSDPGRKAVAAKAPRKQLGGGNSSSGGGGSLTSPAGKSKYSGGNPVRWWPTPSWQKGVADFFSKETKTKELLQADEDRVSSGPGPSIASSSPGPSNACSSPGRSSVSLSPGPSSASSSPGPSSASSSPGPSTAHPGVSTEELGIEPLDED